MLATVESPDSFAPMQSYFTQSTLTLYEPSSAIVTRRPIVQNRPRQLWGQANAASGGSDPPNDPTEMFPWEVVGLAPEDGYPDGIEGVDPFAQWASEATFSVSRQRPPERPAKGKSRSHGEPGAPQIGRRKLVTLLAVGTAGVITVVTVGGISFARSPHQMTKPPSHGGDDGAISTIPQKEREKEKEGV